MVRPSLQWLVIAVLWGISLAAILPTRALVVMASFLLLGIPVWVSPYLLELPGENRVTWQEAMLLIIVFSFLLDVIRGKLDFPRPVGVIRALIIFNIIVIVGVVNGVLLSNPWTEIKSQLRPLIFYTLIVIIGSIVLGNAKVRYIQHILLATLAGAVVGILGSLATWTPSATGGRFYTPLYSGSALLIPVCIQLGFLRGSDRRLAWSSRIALPVLVADLVLSIHRSSWITVLSAVLMLVVFDSRRRFSGLGRKVYSPTALRILLAAVIISGVLVPIRFWLQSSIGEREFEIAVDALARRVEEMLFLGKPASYVQRLDYAAMTWRVFLSHPLTGTGLGAQFHVASIASPVSQGDNIWLAFAVQLGIAGPLALAYLCLSGPLRARTIWSLMSIEDIDAEHRFLQSVAGLIPVLAFVWAGMLATSQNPVEKLPFIWIASVFWGSIEGFVQSLSRQDNEAQATPKLAGR